MTGGLVGRRGLLALPAFLAGCGPAPMAAEAWLIGLLALPLAAGLAYALGAARTHHRTRAELRTVREALRGTEQLHSHWRWHTDRGHRLLGWSAPGQPQAARCALFDGPTADPTLQQRLQAGQAFAGLRLHSTLPLEGHHGWELRGVPLTDDDGRFAGFMGTARPIDDDDALRLAACALTPLLEANPLPALLARHQGAGWLVQQLNAPAQLLWPQLAAGSALSEARLQLPAAVNEALNRAPGAEGGDEADEAAARDLTGWRLTPLGPPLGGVRQLLLTRLPDEQPTAQADAHEADTFSFTLSHDLRAPIRVVEGFTRIVKEDYGRHLDRVGNDHLDRVLGAATRMNLMIDALLTLARLSQQPLARQRVNLSQLAGYVVDDLRRGAPDRAAEFDIEPGLAAWGDPTLLRLVLENLLGNAWKYTGRCTQAQVSMRTQAHGDQTAFVVRDNGAGFDMRSAERLFGLFQRLHSASDFPGHGVGLASVRRIVQRHGGEIWAEAEPGRGAAFFFTLPG